MYYKVSVNLFCIAEPYLKKNKRSKREILEHKLNNSASGVWLVCLWSKHPCGVWFVFLWGCVRLNVAI